MMSCNDQFQEMYAGVLGDPMTNGPQLPTRILASLSAGFTAALFSMPFDYVKSQVQSMVPDAAGRLPYKGAIDCARKTLTNHGPARFYAGFVPYFFRQAPHAIITLCLLAELTMIEDHLEDELEHEMHRPKLHRAKQKLFPK